ncbi:hypothetical protein ACFYKX_05195 [Cytobacillus sp. FJAT-54145]|uniref:DUF4367 domain-containing protein n=1 Tax=Cytobacillus spartinae TaxID=3299023 RepID=A0ABW6K750_9BACI
MKITKNKFVKYILTGIGLVVLYLAIYTPIIRMPLSWSEELMNIKTSQLYIPFSYNKSYMTNESCGRNCSILRMHFMQRNQSLVITISDEVSWEDDPMWRREYQLSGTHYYYREEQNHQFLYWKDHLREMQIDYQGINALSKEELIKIASSIHLPYSKK